MNQPFNLFQGDSSRCSHPCARSEEPFNSLNRKIKQNSRDNRHNEAIFAEALIQLARSQENLERQGFLLRENGNDPPHPPAHRDRVSYRVRLLASALAAQQIIPSGRIQRQMSSIIARLAREPHPSHSVELPLELETLDWQARKIQIDSWSILYAIDESRKEVLIVDIRPREEHFVCERAHLLCNWEYHYC